MRRKRSRAVIRSVAGTASCSGGVGDDSSALLEHASGDASGELGRLTLRVELRTWSIHGGSRTKRR